MIITCAVDTQTGQFLERGEPVDGIRIIRLVVPRNPDAKRERYTGTPDDPFRPATPEELAAVPVVRPAPTLEAVIRWLAQRERLTYDEALTEIAAVKP